MNSSKYTPQPLTWSSPSRDSSGSMPLGNGEMGLNAWCEPDGSLVFYLSKTDAWDENGRLVKLGRLRVRFSPNPFEPGRGFRQTLHIADGMLELRAGEQEGFTARLWVDANRPVLRLEVQTDRPIEATAALELWRTAPRELAPPETDQPIGLRTADQREQVSPDLLFDEPEALLTCHRNETSCWAATLEHQHLGEWIPHGTDPLLHRTFGALVRSGELTKVGPTELRTARPTQRLTLSVHCLTAQSETLDDWVAALRNQAEASDRTALDDARAGHVQWWRAFWQRSWIHITGGPGAETVTRGYTMQRYINACGGRGAMPIKFNGSIFTVDAREGEACFDADYRRWGGGYWFQNTRLTYWAMIAAGDFDLMEPWFQMYLDALELAVARDRLCFGIDGAAMFPETMTFWGTFLNNNYGYDRGDLPPGISQNPYIRRYWQGGLELLAVLLDAWETSGDDALLHEKLLVLAPPILRHYFGYYTRRDEEGKMLLSPSQSLENWHEAVNPSPDIAGLRWVLEHLLALPADALEGSFRQDVARWLDLLPELPTRTYDTQKRKVILPALQYDRLRNSENPELYTVFPYRLFGLGKPGLDVGRATWDARMIQDTGGWRQDAIQAALLGLTDQARQFVLRNFSISHPGSRFPAFWGPNFDWIPDQDHGSVASIALQRMLCQADDGRIVLLPAWPADWDVNFRLHAPGQTVLEGRASGGKLQELTVTPKHRRKDVLLGADPTIPLPPE